ncbi:MAG: lamin tail domain-containing protein [Sedimentisphaerales bacterium]|nr:lamin tail domain-containing protein [Sedimentisphaerales bacterium]
MRVSTVSFASRSVLGLMILARLGLVSGQPLVVNEIMYHPFSEALQAEDLGAEFIELFNAGSAPVNLGGWQIAQAVTFTFPDVELAPGGYLVVAADVSVFEATYPGVGSLVGGWQGRLSDSGETIELRDAAGNLIDAVSYADNGDWGVRELGPVDYDHRGWEWRNDHDRGGKSLELIHPAMPNEYGANWAASEFLGGTPGRTNSNAASDVAPLITDVQHAPPIPGPVDPVLITARVIDESAAGLIVQLRYRLDRSVYRDLDSFPVDDVNDFTVVEMFDDGAHGDGKAADGLYGAEVPPQPDGTVLDFYVEASDREGLARTWPAPSLVDGVPQQVTNALYRVDAAFDPDTYWTVGGEPLYYLVMTEMERGRLAYIGSHSNDAYSAAQMNGTFISVDGEGVRLRYNVGIRNRGKGSRTPPPNNYRANFPSDRRWKGVSAVNINSKYTYLQHLAYAIFQAAGIPTQDTRRVQVRVNGRDLSVTDPARMYGSYVHVEVYDSDWTDRHLPGDSEGNLYRCLSNVRHCDLRYHGEDPARYQGPEWYTKAANAGVDDWSDLIGLTRALDDAPDDTYVDEVETLVNVEQWLRWFAVQAFIINYETNLSNGYGDDYYLYRGAEDPRFILVPYDTGLENILRATDPNVSIWLNGRVDSLPVVRRFLTHPEFVPRFYAQLQDLADTVFSPAQFDPLIDRALAGWVPEQTIDTMKAFMAARRAYVLSAIPTAFSVESELPFSGGYYGASVLALSGTDVRGTANATRTQSVLVNGRLADWSPLEGQWSLGSTGITLLGGVNRVFAEAFNGPQGTGQLIDRRYIDIICIDGGMSAISGALTGDTILDVASGPWHVTGSILVPASVTLTIEPGATLFFAPDAGITIQQGGRLVAEGEPYRHIRFTSLPGSGSRWNGVNFSRTLEDNRLAYIDIEYADALGTSTDVQSSRVLFDHVTWSGTNTEVLNLDHPTVIVRDCVFPSISGTEPLHGTGLSGDESLVFERCTFGTATGYNDIIDFTGAQRPGPILQVYDSIFLGGGDDALDLDGTDAHIEGTVFANFHHASGSDSSSNGIATGQSGGHASQIVATRNLFVGNDHGALLKEDCFLVAHNNTFVASALAAINFGEPERNPPRSPGLGAYLANNIFWDNAALFEDCFQDPLPDYGPSELAIDASILAAPWHDLGLDNVDADPLFVGPSDFQLRPASAARGSGLWGLDMGAYVPAGAAISGEPPAVTYRTEALLTVGGPGITDYRYSLNSPEGPWSEERSVDVLIELVGLEDGQSYTVYALGKNSAGRWQEQPNASRTWTVDVTARRLAISEVLALNTAAFEHQGTFPDLVELYYDGPSALDLTGMMLSDDPQQPDKFVFPPGVAMNPGEYLLLPADDLAATSGLHLGFGLSAEGDGVYLYDRAGVLIDSIEFGPQLADLSIGRIGYDKQWRLTVPTLGQANVAQPLGNPDTVKINEWLAAEAELFAHDFIELYNPSAWPVDIGGFYLTDTPTGRPDRSQIRPLSFIAARGFATFTADGEDAPSHANFRLSPDGEYLGLFDPDLRRIDLVLFDAQTPDVSQGHSGDGAARLDYFLLPTPGLPNPKTAETTVSTVTLVAEGAPKRAFVPTSAELVAPRWNRDVAFDDLDWLSVSGAPGGVGYERGSGYENLIGLDVGAFMYGQVTSCYVRIPFRMEPAVLASLDRLQLRIGYDDGFVAYFNGVEIGRAGFAGTPQWNSHADSNHEAAGGTFDVVFDLTGAVGLLRAGDNLLALQGLNTSATSSDFLISAMLEGVMTETVETPDESYAAEQALLAGLRVTELMYHAAAGDALDYIELQNTSAEPLDLSGLRFTDGIQFTFSPMTLDPGRFVLVVADLAAFQSTYGSDLPVAGQYAGRLGDQGEQLVLKLAAPFEAAVMRFEYADSWYPATDGAGQSLVIRDVTTPPVTWNDPESWRASDPTPGAP